MADSQGACASGQRAASPRAVTGRCWLRSQPSDSAKWRMNSLHRELRCSSDTRVGASSSLGPDGLGPVQPMRSEAPELDQRLSSISGIATIRNRSPSNASTDGPCLRDAVQPYDQGAELQVKMTREVAPELTASASSGRTRRDSAVVPIGEVDCDRPAGTGSVRWQFAVRVRKPPKSSMAHSAAISALDREVLEREPAGGTSRSVTIVLCQKTRRSAAALLLAAGQDD